MDTTHDRLTTIKLLFHMPQGAAMLLDALLEERVISREAMISLGIAHSKSHAGVLAHHVRRFLRPISIELQSQNFTGYWLEPTAKEKLLDYINRFELPAKVEV